MSAPAFLIGNAPATPQASTGSRSSTNAPPGPEPPGATYQSAEEVATKEPNAPAQKPDLGPTPKDSAEPTGKASVADKAKADQPGDDLTASQPVDPKAAAAAAMQVLLASTNVLAFATPVPAPVAAPQLSGKVAGTPKPVQAVVQAKALTVVEASSALAEPSVGAKEKAGAINTTASKQVDVQTETALEGTKIASNQTASAATANKSDESKTGQPTAQPSDESKAPPFTTGIATQPTEGLVSQPPLPVDPATPIVAIASEVAMPQPALNDSTPSAPAPAAIQASTGPVATLNTNKEGAKAMKFAPERAETSDEGQVDTPSQSILGQVTQAGKGEADQANKEGSQYSKEVIEIEKRSETPAESTSQALGLPLHQTQVTTSAAISTSAPLSKSDTHAVIQQMTDHIEFMAAVRPKDGVTIHLQPPDLGSVSMTIKSVGKTIDAQIVASNSSVRDALEQNRPQLSASVQHRGLQLGNVSFGSQSSSTGNHQQSTSRQALEATQDQNSRSGKNAPEAQQRTQRGDATGSPDSVSPLAPSVPTTLSGLGRRSNFDLSI